MPNHTVLNDRRNLITLSANILLKIMSQTIILRYLVNNNFIKDNGNGDKQCTTLEPGKVRYHSRAKAASGASHGRGNCFSEMEW